MVVDSSAYGEVVCARLLRPGERYLVFAPAADKGGVHGGSVASAARAGVGVLSTAGRTAEFRLCSTHVRQRTYTYKGVRYVGLDELDGFRIVKQLGSAAVPVVDMRPCTSDTGIFAAAMGLESGLRQAAALPKSQLC
eukprot:COSAG01_NODE_20374_length_956_cov_2.188811_2_plen_137_part_00